MKKKDACENERLGIRERLCRSLDIHSDVLPMQTHVEICGNSYVGIKGAGKVSLYTDTEIRLVSRHGEICIKGERLCCTAYRRGDAMVDGKIISVSIEETR